ncbi:MAG: F0F1 ATP synthase subunit alpha, partial [Actinomycetota bacterium]|nr:F0F1 ATP synthase subunit alpha [Actinomycetota bacterium]
PYPVEQQVMVIFAGTKGFLDGIEVEDVQRFRDGLLEFVATAHPEVGAAIREEGKLSDETVDKLTEALNEYSATFSGS